ncbi:hypothetical protein Cgig2_015636 [Carnegiea gigantea]|uniref:Piwi domain-containing protein n=1 Tax=Carnegiea gigantea TaxID=171969 RepID=A0A9Q1K1V4_9CARY|nr:hypothetical protein Cgig2_015636 [Carnegiea gigantea]
MDLAGRDVDKLQYLINAAELIQQKLEEVLGGLNSLLAVEQNPSIPLVSKVPTIFLGMDVSHGSPGILGMKDYHIENFMTGYRMTTRVYLLMFLLMPPKFQWSIAAVGVGEDLSADGKEAPSTIHLPVVTPYGHSCSKFLKLGNRISFAAIPKYKT